MLDYKGEPAQQHVHFSPSLETLFRETCMSSRGHADKTLMFPCVFSYCAALHTLVHNI